MSRLRDLSHEEILAHQIALAAKYEDSRPSQVSEVYWIYARRKKGEYHNPTIRSGKWLLYVPLAHVDQAWKQIKDATENGELGQESKVATAKPNPNARDLTRKVICVYTYDYEDEQDVKVYWCGRSNSDRQVCVRAPCHTHTQTTQMTEPC